MSVQSVVCNHASLAQMAAELSIEAVEHGPLWHDSRGVRAHILRRSLVDDVCVAFNDIYREGKNVRKPCVEIGGK